MSRIQDLIITTYRILSARLPKDPMGSAPSQIAGNTRDVVHLVLDARGGRNTRTGFTSHLSEMIAVLKSGLPLTNEDDAKTVRNFVVKLEETLRDMSCDNRRTLGRIRLMLFLGEDFIADKRTEIDEAWRVIQIIIAKNMVSNQDADQSINAVNTGQFQGVAVSAEQNISGSHMHVTEAQSDVRSWEFMGSLSTKTEETHPPMAIPATAGEPECSRNARNRPETLHYGDGEFRTRPMAGPQRNECQTLLTEEHTTSKLRLARLLEECAELFDKDGRKDAQFKCMREATELYKAVIQGQHSEASAQ
ncbi:hypothetical protein RSOLAG1IB_06284 [Rhizoctonia solani AG-1 IB]|uniref:Uncharacterized protein n=1 Tax=Thanatephorus cucumeris (strain AG1-IB / isolate 7/3/14) TaxID=1108050 RepID=A0A0B7FAP3_THACB|nr:hypothetical protein RSOLAG1IB_06284 [Rhizoctonia solani AG-1 IB]